MRGRLPKVGSFTGTGAAQSVQLDFEPVRVELYNETDGDVFAFATNPGSGNTAVTIKIVDSGSGTTDLVRIATSAGITFSSRGFTVGNNGDLCESGKVFRYIAY